MSEFLIAAGIVVAILIAYGWPKLRRVFSASAPSGNTVYDLALALEPVYGRAAHPADLLEIEEFHAGVQQLTARPAAELLGYYRGDNAIIACMALAAIYRRPPEPDLRDRLIETINLVVPPTRYYALRALRSVVPPSDPIVGTLLTRIDPSWHDMQLSHFLHEFVQMRVEAGEQLTFGTQLARVRDEQADFIEEMLKQIGEELTGGLADELGQWRRTRTDSEFLGSIGTIWSEPDDDSPDAILEHEALTRAVSCVEASLEQVRPRSVLLVGEPGVGKTAVARSLARRLGRHGWRVFEAGQTELVAGMMFIGQLEERLRKLLQELGHGRRILWFIPSFHNLFWAGQSQFQRVSVLDFLLPHIERGNIAVLGETDVSAFERLTQTKPRCLTALETVRIEPLGREATLELARRWEERHRTSADPLVSEETLREAWSLLQQYLSDQRAPGNLLQLLASTRRRLAAMGGDRTPEITIDELVVSLSHVTGLPDTILDERQGLDLDALREFFHRSVKGQTEAIDCLVERVAMLKAGVTDPTRPLGVFLFAGPTGTGKTEMAKTLAHFLFGSPDRMIRVDMSELQTPESLGRLLGEPQESSDSGSDSVADRIRKQPFSVVLLDEFEKAHPRVWDLFLQVFDDGRLTDRRGNLADFRHSIIVLTSNLGAVIPSGVVGFSKSDARFRASEVERSIEETFAKEFLNRLDRVVIFQPLSRDTMRQILSKELDDVFKRRGLRNRQWAVEWDDAALEFLLERGFTSDLGARPVKRAVERYLLTPLAMTIVNHQFPEGDQFLFVKSDGEGLEVEFVDPDAEQVVLAIEGVSAAAEQDRVLAGASPALALERIVLDASGSVAEIASLRTKLEQIETDVQSESWQAEKERRLSMTEDPDFWTSPERFAVLGEVEYQDRIERALQSARRLLDRLASGDRRNRYPKHLVTRVAEQLYLLDAACAGARQGSPRDAFLEVVAGGDPRSGAAAHIRFARRLGEMYQSWSRKRRMQTTVIAEKSDDSTHLLLVSVCGFAAYRILAPEAGLHVFESPRPDQASLKRATARVRVAPQPDEPLSYKGKKLATQAAEAFAAAAEAGEGAASGPAIVRRYREEPSPLVRDSVRGWRTGRIDRVFGGDFDLISNERSAE